MVALEKLRCFSVHFTVSTVIFTVSAANIAVHIVKCTGTHRNFSSATMNYPSAVSFLHELTEFLFQGL